MARTYVVGHDEHRDHTTSDTVQSLLKHNVLSALRLMCYEKSKEAKFIMMRKRKIKQFRPD